MGQSDLAPSMSSLSDRSSAAFGPSELNDQISLEAARIQDQLIDVTNLEQRINSRIYQSRLILRPPLLSSLSPVLRIILALTAGFHVLPSQTSQSSSRSWSRIRYIVCLDGGFVSPRARSETVNSCPRSDFSSAFAVIFAERCAINRCTSYRCFNIGSIFLPALSVDSLYTDS